MLESRAPRQLIVLARNPDYQGRFTGNVERVELGYRTDRYTELQLYEAAPLLRMDSGKAPFTQQYCAIILLKNL